MTDYQEVYLEGLKNILEAIEIEGTKLINAVDDDYGERNYIVAMRTLYNNIFSIIEIEFNMEID